MRTKLGFATLFSLGLLVISTASASALTPVQIRNEEMRENNAEFRENVRNTVGTATTPGALRGEVRELNRERVASNAAVRQTYRSERAKLHADRLELRFSWYAERLHNIASRIQSRIDTLKADGKDVNSAQTSLDLANTTLTQAIADGKKAVEMFQSITISTWNVQQPEIKAAIDQANVARKGFVSARQQELDAVQALIGIK